MKISVLAVAGLLFGVMSASAAPDDDKALSAALESVSKDQIVAFNAENVEGAMAHTHTKSPTYTETQEALTAQFSDLDAKAELVSFQFIGHDDEFALARVKVKITAPGVEGFLDNIVDTITIFHQEAGTWKVWDAYLLGGVLVQ
jgi:hypothetical protein